MGHVTRLRRLALLAWFVLLVGGCVYSPPDVYSPAYGYYPFGYYYGFPRDRWWLDTRPYHGHHPWRRR